MNHGPIWEEIATAPYDRDLELAVVEGDHVHQLVFPCRRTPAGWVKVVTHERVAVLLQFLGGRHRTELPANAIEPKEAVS